MSALEQTDRLDERYLCACGCGEEINPIVRHIDELLARGLSKPQVALRLQVSYAYVKMLTRDPKPGQQSRPRYVKGHSARTYWASEKSERDLYRRRRRKQIADVRYLVSVAVGKWSDRVERHSLSDTRRLLRELGEYEYRQAALARSAERERVREAARQERERVREAARQERLLEQWRRWVVAEQKKEMGKRERAIRIAEREAIREARYGETSLFPKTRSLEETVQVLRHGTPVSLGETLSRHEDDVAVAFETNERSETLLRIAGDITPEDVLRMDESELEAIRQRLIEEDIVPGVVQAKEHERLRDSNRHSGASVPKMGRRHGGKRTRAQQQQVTRDHHVRELPGRAKKEHRNLRRARLTKSAHTPSELKQ